MSILPISKYNDSDITFNHIRYTNLTWTSIEPQTHDIFEMIFITDGNLTYSIEGKSYRVPKNSLILTRSGYSHIIHFNSTAVYERYDILFDEKKLFFNIPDIIPDDIHIIRLDEQSEIRHLFKKMDYYYSHFGDENFKNLLFNLIEEIFCNITIANITPASDYSGNPILERAIEYINTNITSSFSLEELCSELFITKSYLHKLFLHNLQITPKKYIVSKRLMMAQKAIRNKEKPSEIYNKCGFTDYSAFYRSYKKYFGHSPSDEENTKIIREIKI